jgi:hypothetical protein
MANGIYLMTYRGSASWGQGMLVLRNGVVAGADASGGVYDGTYRDTGPTLAFTAVMRVPPGALLVQGVPPQPTAYDVPFVAEIPKDAIRSQSPVLVEMLPGPVNVIIKLLRPLDL